MMKRLIGLLALGLSTFSMQAQEGFYLNAGLGGIAIDDGYFTAGGSQVNGAVGYRFSEHWAVEGQFSTAEDLEDGPITLGADFVGASVLVAYSLSERLSAYGRLGVTNWQTDARLGYNTVVKSSGTDLTVGGGLSFAFSEHFHIRQDYQYFSLNEGEGHSLGLSIVYNF